MTCTQKIGGLNPFQMSFSNFDLFLVFPHSLLFTKTCLLTKNMSSFVCVQLLAFSGSCLLNSNRPR
ncbi:hypothetical protein RchiOBHm_Chr2g0115991 [Rosa chinensis]|uniref:Uncharacterized protein n=1 Tax=Rosa chinensis TaxID=74649 RepID=A0A2P6RR52_ROSCH|nr:hypothetical protein RchiOBHm_Chr2g0115991 [Rosa chinensis]